MNQTSATRPRDGSAKDRITSGLREDILSGRIAPGARIRQEDIAARFDASRLPVREALLALEADGLVTVVKNSGAWVSSLSLAECEEIYQIRERIEPLLLRMSIPGLDAAALDELDRLADEMEQTDDVEEFLTLDRRFHLLAYSGAKTYVLGEQVARLWNTTQHYRRLFTRHVDEAGHRLVHHEHHLLASAIRAGDLEDAERIAHGHVRRTRVQLAAHPELFQAPARDA